MTVTLITLTGERQKAFSLCETWMKTQQGVKIAAPDFQWIVVDDGRTPTRVTMGQEYIRGPRIWSPGVNTQRFNMEAALKLVKGEKILIIEDDDWYAPTYVKTMIDMLDHVDAVGEGNAKYYYLPKSWYHEMGNFKHASLCQTGMTKTVLPLLADAVNSGEKYYDIFFWAHVIRHRYLLMFEKNLSVGMKGLPGRQGIGVGHVNHNGYKHDKDFKVLKEWVGQGAVEVYKALEYTEPTKQLIKAA